MMNETLKRKISRNEDSLQRNKIKVYPALHDADKMSTDAECTNKTAALGPDDDVVLVSRFAIAKAPALKQDAVTVYKTDLLNGAPPPSTLKNGAKLPPDKSNMANSDNGSKANEATRVFIKVDFVKISDIDTKSQKFIAEIAVRQSWTHPSVANMTPLEFAQLPPDQRWDPKLYISNLEDKKSDEVLWSLDVSSGTPTVYLFRRLKGTFFENMELMDFPNDIQDISVTFISEKSSNEVMLFPDEELGIIDVATFQDGQEWHLFQHVKFRTGVIEKIQTMQIPIPDQVPENVDNDHLKHNVMLSRQSQIMQSTLTATAKVSRKMKFFFYNAYLVMFFITALSFTGFSIQPTEHRFRIGGTLTLLLTSVAFKIAVSNTLPTISYLTKLDIYVLVGVSYLSSKVALFALLSIWNKSEHVKTIDRAVLISLGSLQICWQCFYLCFFYFTTFGKKRETLKEERAYLENLSKQRETMIDRVAVL